MTTVASLVQAAASRFTDRVAVIVALRQLRMTAAEIAETLGIPVGTVQSRLLYATRAMRAVLEADARPLLVAEGGRR